MYKEVEKGVECTKIKLKKGKIISDNYEVANILNVHFKEKIVNIKKSLLQTNEDPCQLMKTHIGNRWTSFQLKWISIKDAKLALRRSKPKMSCGITEVPKKLIINVNSVLVLPFQRLCNISIASETFFRCIKGTKCGVHT